jgi:SAM-dependent methyltransferase
MKRLAEWQPTKLERRGADFVVRSDGVGPGSLLMAMAMSEALVPLLGELSGRIVDLGAGRVPFYEVYASRVTEAICVDWSNSLHGVVHADIIANMDRVLPFASCSFDGAVMSSVLEHLSDPAAALRETARILRPGGKLVLEVPFLYWLHEEPYDFGRYTEHWLRHAAGLAALQVDCLRPYGGIAAITGDVAAKATQIAIERLRGMLPGRPGAQAAKLMTWLNRRGQRTLFRCLISSARRGHAPASASRFPLGYVAVFSKPLAGGDAGKEDQA